MTERTGLSAGRRKGRGERLHWVGGEGKIFNRMVLIGKKLRIGEKVPQPKTRESRPPKKNRPGTGNGTNEARATTLLGTDFEVQNRPEASAGRRRARAEYGSGNSCGRNDPS